MKRLTLVSTALAGLIGFAATASGSELVKNGGFETGDFTGWTQGGNTGATYVSGPGISGTFDASLGPVGSVGTLSQILATVIGQTYSYSFDWMAFNGTPSFFGFSLGDKSLISLVDTYIPGVLHFSGNYTAASNATKLAFTFQQDPAYQHLDNVSVTGVAGTLNVPSPVAGAGLPVLLGLIGFAAWHRRQQAA